LSTSTDSFVVGEVYQLKLVLIVAMVAAFVLAAYAVAAEVEICWQRWVL
jgi:hypothetical protein